jgi:hypothetical protein
LELNSATLTKRDLKRRTASFAGVPKAAAEEANSRQILAEKLIF